MATEAYAGGGRSHCGSSPYGQPARTAFSSAARVAGPRTPSGLSWCAVWNLVRACSVDVPKTPSTVPTAKPIDLSACWSSLTGLPPSPSFKVEAGTAGTGVDDCAVAGVVCLVG